jgi:putative PIN family toxin of toxin-antitoxin system
LQRFLTWTLGDIDLFFIRLEAQAEIARPTRRVDAVSRDPDDNRVLEAAIAGHADYIVTRDGDLLDLQEFEGIPIVSPARFLAILTLDDLDRAT